MTTVPTAIKELVEEIYPELVVLRHTIHANTELSEQDFETSYTRLPNSTAIIFRIGVNPNPAAGIEPAHSPRFTAGDEALRTGVTVTTAAALAFLQKERSAV